MSDVTAVAVGPSIVARIRPRSLGDLWRDAESIGSVDVSNFLSGKDYTALICFNLGRGRSSYHARNTGPTAHEALEASIAEARGVLKRLS